MASALDRLFNEIALLRGDVQRSLDIVRDDISAQAVHIGVLLDDRGRAADQRRRTYEEVAETRERVGVVERKLEVNTVMCANMQADIGKLQEVQDRVEQARPLFRPALEKLDAIDGRVSRLERAGEALHINLEWWKRLGWFGWTVVAGGFGLLAAGLVSLGVHWIGPALMTWFAR